MEYKKRGKMKNYSFIKDINQKVGSKSYQKIADKANDFIFLEAVRFNQSAWVDTGLKGNLNTEVDIIVKLERSSDAGSGSVFGSRGSNQAKAFSFGTGSGKVDADSLFYFGFNGRHYNSTTTISITNWQRKRELRVKKDYMYIKNLETGTESIYTPEMNDSEFETLTTMLIGGYRTNNNYPSHSIKGLVYSCKIWESGILKRDFRPAKRKRDNRVGFFEMVEGRFYLETPNSTAQLSEA